ncbi:hypothetical protein [Flavobacterium filum]|uniref:hypothetical protein n=1 Tax=Flavobacterium filum TaxID=370974 RepID=UPI0023F5870C|nr:hypothetical protein [Flavobacterium filum]
MINISIYQACCKNYQIGLQYDIETFCLSLNQISSLFEKVKSIIKRPLKVIFTTEEFQKSVNIEKNETTTQHVTIKEKLQTRFVEYGNLDSNLSVLYLVKYKLRALIQQWIGKPTSEGFVGKWLDFQAKIFG